MVKQIVPLDAAVESWIELANQKNGHDNVAVVLMNAIMTSVAGEMAEDVADEASAAVAASRSQESRQENRVSRTAGREVVVSAAAGSSSALARSGGGTATATLPPPPAVMTPASRALLYGEDDDDDTPLTAEEMADFAEENKSEASKSQPWVTALLALVVAGVIGAVAWLLWQAIEPTAEDLLPNQQTEEIAPE